MHNEHVMHSPEHSIKTFTASDAYRMHYRHWSPQGDHVAGHVIALHGIQSHSGWYEYSSGRLCEAGFDVRFLDRRGSGLNQQDRGHADHHERLINDVVQFIRALKNEPTHDRRAPIILLAVSWGAKIACAVAALQPELVDQLVLLYPGLCPSVRPKWHQARLIALAGSAGKRRRLVRIPLDDPSLFTTDAKWQQFIANDPHTVHDVSIGFLLAGQNLDQLISDRTAQIRCPTWMALAGDDAIIDNTRTSQLFETFGSNDRTLVTYPGCRHTLEFEPDRERIFSQMIEALMKSIRRNHQSDR